MRFRSKLLRLWKQPLRFLPVSLKLRPKSFRLRSFLKHMRFWPKTLEFQPTLFGFWPKFSLENLCTFKAWFYSFYIFLINFHWDFDCFWHWLCIMIFNLIFWKPLKFWTKPSRFDQTVWDFDKHFKKGFLQ